MALHELVRAGVPTGDRRDFATPPDFTGHPAKAAWAWLPVVALAPQGYDPATQVIGSVLKSVDNGIVYDTPQVRDKTPGELEAEDFGRLQGRTGQLFVLQVRLIEQLLADNTIQASDFRSGVRQAYQDAKTIADRLDPPA